MKTKRTGKLHQSTVFRLFAIIVAMVLPINIITLVLVQAVIENNQNTIDLQAENALAVSAVNLSETIKKANRDLQYLSFDNTDVSILEGDLSGYTHEEKLMLLGTVSSTLTDLSQEYTEIDMVYFNFISNEYNLLTGYSGLNRESCLQAINSVSEDTTQQYGTSWQVLVIDDATVLLGFNRWHGAEFGALINLDRLVNRIALPEYEEEYCTFFVDSEEQICSATGREFLEEHETTLQALEKDREYNIYKVPLENYNLEIVQVVAQRNFMSNMSAATRILEILAILLTVIAMPMLMIYMKRWVVNPLNRLTKAINRIEGGDLEYRIEEGNQSLEFEQINHSFNEMMEQVQELKIDVYEQELEKRDIVMRYLSQQIQPHFILNAMNILYSYEPEEYELSQKMILCISKYFRYIVNANERFVKLEDEMNHIINYFEIQKARFPGLFYSIVEYEEGLKEALIPPLLLQNFAENAIKHSLKIGNKITIFVVGEYYTEAGAGTGAETGAERLMRIRMADTGEGISDEILEEIEEFKRTGVHQPHLGVGIENSIERLKYLYAGTTNISYSRDEHYQGTNIEIILPIHFEEEKDHENTVG